MDCLNETLMEIKKEFLSFCLVFGFVWLFWALVRVCVPSSLVVFKWIWRGTFRLFAYEWTNTTFHSGFNLLASLFVAFCSHKKRKRISNNFSSIWHHVPLIQNLDVCQSLFPVDFCFSWLACHPPKIAFVGSGTFFQHHGLKIHHIFITFAICNTLLTDL